MGGEVLGLDLVPAHAVEDLRDVAVPVLLGAAQGQRLVHHGAEGELVHEAGEDAEGEHRSALAAGVDRLAHRRGPVGLQPQLLLDLVVRYCGPGLCASMPTASMQTSGPRPPVISRSSAGTSTSS